MDSAPLLSVCVGPLGMHIALLQMHLVQLPVLSRVCCTLLCVLLQVHGADA